MTQRRISIRQFLLMQLLVLLVACRFALGQVDSSIPAHVTVAIFANDPAHIDSWDAIFAALRRNLPEAAAIAPAIDPNPDLIRGDSIVPGMNVSAAIVIYLRGDCTLHPLRKPFPQGEVLGWVYEQSGKIQPYIFVDCARIDQALSVLAEYMNRNQRTAAMSEAIARVILHEWIHIANQRSSHHGSGLSKAHFSVEDLISPAIDNAVARGYNSRFP
ncbi:MAG TPA: hypothetical protein VF742_13610 [Terracidiphilus sp.]|jgi:hypothetical protein